MTVMDIFNLANKFAQEGKGNQAVEMWLECTRMEPGFGPAYINLANAYKQINNLVAAREALNNFMNCPITGNTLDIVPKIKQELAEINQKLNPQPPQK